MHYILFDGDRRNALLPFTYTRPVADIRTGILTLQEKWKRRLGQQVGYLTEAYLQEKFPMDSGTDNVLIKGSLLADTPLLHASPIRPSSKIVSVPRGLGFPRTTRKDTSVPPP